MWCNGRIPDCTLLQVTDNGEDEDEITGGFRRNDLWRCNDDYPFTCDKEIDPEISGIGIILAFTISAVIVFVVILVGYFTRQLGTESFNRIDRGVLSVLHRRKIKKNDERSDWSEVSDKTVLMLSDQQLVTGIAILIAAFAQMCTINTYHFQTCTFLAWIASNTHLLAMTSLRPFLKARPNLLRWRLVGICVMFVMLFAALVLNASRYWPSSWNDEQFYYDSPARCAWHKEYYGTWEDSIIFSLVLLCVNYITRILRLFDNSKAFMDKWLREKPGRLTRRLLDRLWRYSHKDDLQRYIWRTIYSLAVGIHLVCFAVLELYSSYLSELAWLFATLFWGLCKLFIVRRDSPLTEYENTWGFGQVLALGLLILPIMAAVEVYHDVALHHRQHNHIPISHNEPAPVPQGSVLSSGNDVLALNAKQASIRLVKPARAVTDLASYTSTQTTSAPLRFSNTLPDLNPTPTLSFINTIPLPNTSVPSATTTHPSHDHQPTSTSSSPSNPLPFTNTLPSPTPTHPITTDPHPLPTAPHHLSPYRSPYFILLLILLAGLTTLPFIIFIQAVFAFSTQFTIDVFAIALIFWGFALAGAIPGWILFGVVCGSGLWGTEGKRRGVARWVVKGGLWCWRKLRGCWVGCVGRRGGSRGRVGAAVGEISGGGQREGGEKGVVYNEGRGEQEAEVHRAEGLAGRRGSTSSDAGWYGGGRWFKQMGRRNSFVGRRGSVVAIA